MITHDHIWLWIYFSMAVGVFSIGVVLWAMWFDYKNKDRK